MYRLPSVLSETPPSTNCLNRKTASYYDLVLCLSKYYTARLDSVRRASRARHVANSRGRHGPPYECKPIMETEHPGCVFVEMLFFTRGGKSLRNFFESPLGLAVTLIDALVALLWRVELNDYR
jgi:hypothetical protein